MLDSLVTTPWLIATAVHSAGAKGELDSLLANQSQVRGLERGYPGGVTAYVANAKKLLAESAKGVNPFEGMKPEVRSPSLIYIGRSSQLARGRSHDHQHAIPQFPTRYSSPTASSWSTACPSSLRARRGA